MEHKQRLIKKWQELLLLEGEQLEVFEQFADAYMSSKDLARPLIRKMSNEGSSYGQIENKLGVQKKLVEYNASKKDNCCGL